MSKLAIFGGKPVIQQAIPIYNSLGKSEEQAAVEVVKTGILSGFYGSFCPEFYGGEKVKELEAHWSKRFQISHSVSVNSATSGLMAAIGACGVEPGDEVLLPPYTMSATAMAPLIYGGIPVFVDLEPDTFCLDTQAVEKAITPKTKAIIAVNLFGHPARLAELRALSDKHHIKLIEDNAQGILATENEKYAGTIGHIGVFSLNYHKHIHTGEGGICVTDDPDLALRLQLIRNHGENVVEPLQINNISGLVGFNFRMTELSAAIGIEQLRKCEIHVNRREQLAKKLMDGISGLEGLVIPKIRPGCRHVFYVFTLRVDEAKLGISRDVFSKGLEAEGFPHFKGAKPLYKLPLFQQRVAFGKYPFNLSNIDYTKIVCPISERMYEKELICFETCMYDINEDMANLLIEAIQKVYRCRMELKSLTSQKRKEENVKTAATYCS